MCAAGRVPFVKVGALPVADRLMTHGHATHVLLLTASGWSAQDGALICVGFRIAEDVIMLYDTRATSLLIAIVPDNN